MIALHHSEDVTEHARRLVGWQQEFNQIEEGCFSGDLIDVSADGMRLFRESANLGIAQSICFPQSQWHLVIPLHWDSGSHFAADTLSVLPDCEQFWSVSPRCYDVLVVSIDRERYSWLGQQQHQLRTLEVPLERLDAVRWQWRNLTDHVRTASPAETASPEFERVIARQLEEGVALLLEGNAQSLTRDDTSLKTRRYIVDRCHSLINDTPDDPPSVMSLCQQLKISRRTLQYSFQAETGQSPVHYLRALRLNAVRRRLLQNPERQVADAAALHGFFHQSYFSREYRRLFQEAPSVTRQRSLAA